MHLSTCYRLWSMNCQNRILPFLVLAAVFPGSAGLDREKYSLIIRKPAHQYRELTALEREELALYNATRVCNADGFVARVALEPFRPFAYCHLHKSRHIPESVAAVVLSPIEYPGALGGDIGGTAVRGGVSAVGRIARTISTCAVWIWEQVFSPPEKPLPEPPRKPDPPVKR